MKIIKTEISDVLIIEPKIFGDHRGYFYESYNEKSFKSLGIENNFIQDNEAFSRFGTLRGLHFQTGEYAQAKLVRVTQGKVLDVAVDLRENSSSYGKHVAVELSDENKRMLLVPRGFAHGYVVLSETALFQYKCDNFYAPEHEGGLLYNDPELGIDWRVAPEDLILSDKDKRNPKLSELRL